MVDILLKGSENRPRQEDYRTCLRSHLRGSSVKESSARPGESLKGTS